MSQDTDVGSGSSSGGLDNQLVLDLASSRRIGVTRKQQTSWFEIVLARRGLRNDSLGVPRVTCSIFPDRCQLESRLQKTQTKIMLMAELFQLYCNNNVGSRLDQWPCGAEQGRETRPETVPVATSSRAQEKDRAKRIGMLRALAETKLLALGLLAPCFPNCW